MPSGTTTGKINVTTLGGTATSATNFIVINIGNESTNPTDGAAMVRVPGGSFTMGSEYSAWWDAPKTQQVTLSNYWIYKYEVTVAQYRAFCAATSRALPSFPSGYYSWTGKSGWTDAALQQHPIINVSCLMLRPMLIGLVFPYLLKRNGNMQPVVRKRIITLGGTATAIDPYNGWDQTKSVNYYNANSNGISTQSVDSLPAGASWCGAQDLSGNVWNGVRTGAGVILQRQLLIQLGPSTGSVRVQRGGSWYDGRESNARGAYRSSGCNPVNWYQNVGFRCVSSPPVASPTIMSFTPTSGPIGQLVTITGTNLTGVTAVTFNDMSALSFTVVNDTSITVMVPVGATSGTISITTADGTVRSTTEFIVTTIVESINLTDGADMVWIPGGTFTMGSLDGIGYSYEHPAHQVTLSGYWIYKYEVTVAQYRTFCAATSHALPSFPEGFSWAGKSGWTDETLQQHPMVCVGWNDATAYAVWAGVQLPTEAQWEYAARGPSGGNYPWGGTATVEDPNNSWDEMKCANGDNSFSVEKSTWPVGSFPAGVSWCGAQDLAGNAWEWCLDKFGDYSSAPSTNPGGPTEGDVRVLRGGSWAAGIESYFRGAFRYYGPAESAGNDVGFRCASSSSGP